MNSKLIFFAVFWIRCESYAQNINNSSNQFNNHVLYEIISKEVKAKIHYKQFKNDLYEKLDIKSVNETIYSSSKHNMGRIFYETNYRYNLGWVTEKIKNVYKSVDLNDTSVTIHKYTYCPSEIDERIELIGVKDVGHIRYVFADSLLTEEYHYDRNILLSHIYYVYDKHGDLVSVIDSKNSPVRARSVYIEYDFFKTNESSAEIIIRTEPRDKKLVLNKKYGTYPL